MSHFTTADFRKAKESGEKITMLTAYDYPTAKLIDEAGIDAILVGDSLGMVVLGYDDTTKVTMEDMIHHIKAVVRGTKNAMVIGDLPFLSYHMGVYESVKNAGRLVQEGGCKSVKLEGGKEVADSVQAIVKAGIPVMGHLGYTPQSVNVFGGHKAQGKTFDSAEKMIDDALALQNAGAYAIVLECVPYKIAEIITKMLDIPTIGIGAGTGCDGQILVTPDLIGLFRDFSPKHNKRYIDVGKGLTNAVIDYISDVKTSDFPTLANTFKVDDQIVEELSKKYMTKEYGKEQN